MELSTYFRINASNTGQFERTLIIADKGSYVSYLEGCTAPMRDENQLHAANVELIALDDAEIKYSTVQNWYPGDENGKGGIYNFVTKLYIPPFPSLSPGYQFCTVEYFISASSSAISSTLAACN